MAETKEVYAESGDPILYHSHGIGRFDYSSMSPEDLEPMDALARERGVYLVPTIFLRREYLHRFAEVTRSWSRSRASGRLTRILGFGIEGPLLGTSGGVPPAGCWIPEAHEWLSIVELGLTGLKYVVIAPDAVRLDDDLSHGMTFSSLIESFYAHGVRLALGHFRHDDPPMSAERTAEVIDFVQGMAGGRADALVTDHLFNDMPRAFRHAWRTPGERGVRDRELADFLAQRWSDDTLDQVLGPVPATLIRAAGQDRLRPMLNFDGDHVDLRICGRTVEYLGARRIIAITDHTEILHMAGEPLRPAPSSSLKLRHDGIVAAGSTGIEEQTRKMRELGITDRDIDMMTRLVPGTALGPLDVRPIRPTSSAVRR